MTAAILTRSLTKSCGEQRGTVDLDLEVPRGCALGFLGLLLAYPVSRRRLVLQEFRALAVLVSAIGVAFWASLAIATAIVGTPVSAFLIFEAVLHSGGTTPLGRGLGAVDVAVLVGASLVLLVLTLALFERRDIRV